MGISNIDTLVSSCCVIPTVLERDGQFGISSSSLTVFFFDLCMVLIYKAIKGVREYASCHRNLTTTISDCCWLSKGDDLAGIIIKSVHLETDDLLLRTYVTSLQT